MHQHAVPADFSGLSFVLILDGAELSFALRTDILYGTCTQPSALPWIFCHAQVSVAGIMNPEPSARCSFRLQDITMVDMEAVPVDTAASREAATTKNTTNGKLSKSTS